MPSEFMIGASLVFLLNFTSRYFLANDIYESVSVWLRKCDFLIISMLRFVDERGMDIVDATSGCKIRLH